MTNLAHKKSLAQWLAYIETMHCSEIDMGLDRILLVYRKLQKNSGRKGKPGAKVVTVAGTNGKGSTVAVIERLLLNKGAQVGCYTSPHIERFNERVRVNGIEVEDQALVDSFVRVEAARGKTSLTYFEYTTLVAFDVFAQSSLDYAVLEVGLGGRLDAVNIIDPDLAIITSVDLDHMDWLGDDREKIGFEKAGILRFGQSAIYAEANPPSSVLQQVQAQKVTLLRLGQAYGQLDAGEDGGNCTDNLADSVTARFRVIPFVAGQKTDSEPVSEVHFQLSPHVLPLQNRMAAIQAVLLLGESLVQSEIDQCFRDLVVPGRLELIDAAQHLWVDVGHNPHAARFLAGRIQALKAQHTSARCCVLFSMLSDKDIESVTEILKPVVDVWYLFPLSVPRACSLEQLESLARKQTLEFKSFGSAGDALRDLLQSEPDKTPTQFNIACGSFYTVAAVKNEWKRLNGK